MPKLWGRKKEAKTHLWKNLGVDFLPTKMFCYKNLDKKIYYRKSSFWRAGGRFGSWVAVLSHAVLVAKHVKMSWHNINKTSATKIDLFWQGKKIVT